ncbi:MAG: hypothetical protein AVDCRST_MAG38-1419 [uncultured Solirubrobacteraceae bacterium]|uniref:Asl1-like glycosyl hydrolase catalytic domain-containing protein n=1 Tax=uncultured Solirubrobacteraceae bacterium TaxID=1162706 RepID=A0A6J4RJH7_9ACTN|nr:MAG: hypothetical protein AVDCRST_MAG38-1419 [uncultured Solirubrobacteraceae bacterium]
MRSRLLPSALALLALLLLPSAAQAKLTVGISENSPSVFTDPLFQQLGAKHTRVVTSWNVMSSPERGDDELARLTQYLEAARAQGVTPLVTFEHARGDAGICKRRSNRRKPQCVLPSARQYEREFKRFRAAFPYVTTISPFNEVNHFTQPTSRNAKAAARFTDIARRNCRGCKIVAVDILDQADNVRAKRPTFNKTVRYIKAFRRALKSPRTICGVHNYSDVNRGRSTGTKAIIKALGCREIWLTETGGVYSFGSFKPSAKRQLKSTKFMFKVARQNRRIKRLYVYTFFGRINDFDSGLVARGKARPAYFEVKKRI